MKIRKELEDLRLKEKIRKDKKKREKEERKREEREENERREKEEEERQQSRKQQQKEELRMRQQYEEEFLFEKAKDSGFRCFSEVCYQTMSHNFDINLSS